jgi:hypothetical protein
MKATTDSFRGLIAAVINRALADLKKTTTAMGVREYVRDEAMAWINSPECEAFCHALDADYRMIREKAASLYRRFLEEARGHEKAPRKPRKSVAGAGKPRPMARPEGQSIRRPQTVTALSRKE